MPASSRCSCCNSSSNCRARLALCVSDAGIVTSGGVAGSTMRGFALRESGRLAFGLLGALLLAAAVSALSLPGAHDNAQGFLAAVASRLLAYVTFDLGSSAVSGLSAAQELIARGPTTLTLMVQGIVIAATLGIPHGLLSGAASLRNARAPLGQFFSAVPVFCADRKSTR